MDIRPVAHVLPTTSSGVERERQSAAAAPASAAPGIANVARSSGEPEEAGDADLQHAVERINESLPPSSQGIEFAVDADSERVIVKVVDRETREVLRQMPTQEALDIAKALDRNQGLLIRQEA